MTSTILVEKPSQIIRATLPIPSPYLTWTGGSSPYSIVAPNGDVLPTQFERAVRRGPNGDLVSVCELLARDDQPPASGPATYSVTTQAQPDARVKPGPWAEMFLSSPPMMPFDGNPVGLSFASGFFRQGKVAVTRKFYGPNVFGWITVFDGQDIAHIDVILHAAEVAAPEKLFSTFGFLQGVKFEPSWPEPMLVGGALAPARTDGFAKHWVGQRQARWWSGVIHDGTKTAEAQAMAAGAGWGVSSEWTKVAGFQAQSLPLPDLAYRKSQLQAKCASEWAIIKNALANGLPYGMGSTVGGRKDIYHPWAGFYGGVTGGGDRYQWEPVGISAVLSGETDGLLYLRAKLRMIMDRTHVAIVDHDGEPIAMEAYVDMNGQPLQGWQMGDTDCRFVAGKDGIFRYAMQPKPLNPPPERAYLTQTYSPLDWQHFDRAFMPAVALVWLENSPVGAWWIETCAEAWKMNEATGSDKVRSRLVQANASPGLGTSAGRAHGHGWALAAHAYAVADKSRRAAWNVWIGYAVDSLLKCQMVNGLYRQHWQNKDAEAIPFGNGTQANWAITKVTEESLLANSLVAMRGMCELGLTKSLAVQASLAMWVAEGLLGMLMKDGTLGTPTYTIGIRHLMWPGPVVELPETNPLTIIRNASDRTECPSPLGASLLLGVTPAAKAAALKLCGNAQSAPAALAYLKAQNLTQFTLDDTAPLHAALERMP